MFLWNCLKMGTETEKLFSTWPRESKHVNTELLFSLTASMTTAVRYSMLTYSYIDPCLRASYTLNTSLWYIILHYFTLDTKIKPQANSKCLGKWNEIKHIFHKDWSQYIYMDIPFQPLSSPWTWRISPPLSVGPGAERYHFFVPGQGNWW